MKRDDIIRAVRDAGMSFHLGVPREAVVDQLARFAAAMQGRAWTPVADGLPKSGVKVLACYRNRLGNLRRIRAQWVAAKTEEVCGDADDWGEYDEEADCYWTPQGWYECIDNWGDYSSVAVCEGEVTHWMPLPDPPGQEAVVSGAAVPLGVPGGGHAAAPSCAASGCNYPEGQCVGLCGSEGGACD